MIAPIESLGATVAWYPINEFGAPDIAFLRASDLSSVRAMLAAHFFGFPINLGPVRTFCDANRIALIEDCAHCIFGSYEGLPVGSLGDYAIGSLAKFFPVSEGGLLCSRRTPFPSASIQDRPRRFAARAAWDVLDLSSRTGRLGLVGKSVQLIRRLRPHPPTDGETKPIVSLNATANDIRLSALNDPLLQPRPLNRADRWIVRHSRLDAIASARRNNYMALVDALKGQARASPFLPALPPVVVPYVMPLIVEAADEPYRRMRELGLPVLRWDRRWPTAKEFSGALTDHGARWSTSLLQIACHQSLRLAELERLTILLRKCLA